MKSDNKSFAGINCVNCLFGAKATRVNKKKVKGEEIEIVNNCMECRRKIPSASNGFAIIRPDDYCAYHTNAATGALTFRDILKEAPINPA